MLEVSEGIMKLSEHQMRFTENVGELISYVYGNLRFDIWNAMDPMPDDCPDVGMTFGDAYENQGHYPEEFWIHTRGSLHSKRCAVDFNLFVDGRYIRGYHRAWDLMAERWKSYDPLNRWGGDIEGKRDFNHFSRYCGGRVTI